MLVRRWLCFTSIYPLFLHDPEDCAVTTIATQMDVQAFPGLRSGELLLHLRRRLNHHSAVAFSHIVIWGGNCVLSMQCMPFSRNESLEREVVRREVVSRDTETETESFERGRLTESLVRLF